MEQTNILERNIELAQVTIWDNSRRVKQLMVVFWILVGMTVIGVLSDYMELELLKAIQSGIALDQEEISANDLRQGVIAILQTGLYIASIIVFLQWFRRAYGNLHRLGINYLRHKESMAIWAWMIPIICVFRPVQIMNEIWKETQKGIKKYDSTFSIKNGELIIGLWWTLVIITNFIGRYLLKTAFKQDTIEQLIESSQASIVSDVLQIVEALLIITIVSKISKFETRLANEIENSGGAIVYN